MLDAQGVHWLTTVANCGVNGTTKVVPCGRVATEEIGALQPLPAHPYRPLVLASASVSPSARPTRPVPQIAVERRALSAYAHPTDVGGAA